MPLDPNICVYLFIFGVAYAIAVYYANRQGWTEGFTALLVVFGVGVTLLGCYIQEIRYGSITTWQVFTAFAITGLPMTIGDIAAYVNRRKNGRKVFEQIDGENHARPT